MARSTRQAPGGTRFSRALPLADFGKRIRSWPYETTAAQTEGGIKFLQKALRTSRLQCYKLNSPFSASITVHASERPSAEWFEDHFKEEPVMIAVRIENMEITLRRMVCRRIFLIASMIVIFASRQDLFGQTGDNGMPGQSFYDQIKQLEISVQ
jgi:hypothetical protein